MATLDEVQPHQISLKPRVILESLRAGMLGLYLCSTETPDSAHIIHEVQIRDRKGEMQSIWAHIDCGETSILIAPRHLLRLEISHEVAHITTFRLKWGVMQHAKASRKTRNTVQYIDYLAKVDELDVLVEPMRAYDQVLDLPWFHKNNPDIDRARRLLTSLQSPNAGGVEEITQITTAVASKVSETENYELN